MKKLMALCLLSLMSVGVAACVASTGPSGGTEEATGTAAEAAEALTCPRAWTCDWVDYYSSKAKCVAACGGDACYSDYECSDKCYCP
jgi:hypothetical protein